MDQNEYNIPAFLRKKSIASQAKKTTKRKTTRRKKTSSTSKEISINRPLPSDDLFNQTGGTPRKNTFREMQKCGICEGYFENIDVAVIKLTAPLRDGDRIIFEKPDGLFEQEVKSMQINRKEVKLARTGSDIGLKTRMAPTVGGNVYKVLT